MHYNERLYLVINFEEEKNSQKSEKVGVCLSLEPGQAIKYQLFKLLNLSTLHQFVGSFVAGMHFPWCLG